MKEYVVGFMFSPTLEVVALIRKQKPEWQRGKLNGIGGKIEPQELPSCAMAREFKEETGHETKESDWVYFLRMGGKENDDGGEFTVHFFACVGPVYELQTMEAEHVCLEDVVRIQPRRKDLIDNLAWTIGLAVDVLQDGRPAFVKCQYP